MRKLRVELIVKEADSEADDDSDEFIDAKAIPAVDAEIVPLIVAFWFFLIAS